MLCPLPSLFTGVRSSSQGWGEWGCWAGQLCVMWTFQVILIPLPPPPAALDQFLLLAKTFFFSLMNCIADIFSKWFLECCPFPRTCQSEEEGENLIVVRRPSFIVAYTSAGRLGVCWAWLPCGESSGLLHVWAFWGQAGGQQLLGEALSRAVAEVKKWHERHYASLVHEFGCIASAYIPCTKISHVDKPKVKEQRGVSLLGDGGRGREYVQ